MSKTILTLFIAFFVSTLLYAQDENQYLSSRIRPSDSTVNQVRLNLNSFNFVRNYEYSNFFHDGYTLYGTQLESSISYFPHQNFALSIGAYLRKDFGANGLYDTKPLLTATYKKNNLSLIFGTLEGNIQHAYVEPLLDFEYKISSPIRYGTQLIINNEKLKFNSWVAWQKMIYPGSTNKEEIVGGFTSDYFVKNDNKWKISLPIQIFLMHKGGQIDVLKNIPIATLYAGALGLKLNKKLANANLNLDNYLLTSKDLSPTKLSAFKAGMGLFSNLGFSNKLGLFSLSYWHGNSFYAINGMPLFQSVSYTLNNLGYTEKYRDILLFKYVYQKELVPNLYLDLRFEPFIDLNHTAKNLQFNHSLFLTYKTNFKLFSIKP